MLPRLLRPAALVAVALASCLAGPAWPGLAAQAVAQTITIESPPPGTQVGSPVVVTGSVARLPIDARLFYSVLASDGHVLGQGSFAIPGNPGQPAYFIASLGFSEPREGDNIRLELVERDPATGGMLAVASVNLTVAPLPQRIVIETPVAGARVGNPVVVTGHTVRFPAAGVLGYAIYDSSGRQVGGGVFPVAGSLQEGGRFSASLGFLYPELGGPLRIDLYDQDPYTGAFPATATLQVTTLALRQQLTITSPAPGTQVGSPVVIAGRAARFPIGGILQYRISDGRGLLLGAGSFPVAGYSGEPASFAVSLTFTPPTANGPLRAEIFETDAVGTVTASAVVEMRWGP